MDGLLIDSESLSLQTFNDTISAYGLPDHSELFNQLIGKNEASLVAAISSALAKSIDVSAFRKDWADRYHAIVENDPVALKPGAIELLTWLNAQKIKTAVATSSKTSLAQIKLKNADLLQYFQYVIGGDQVAQGKPDPEIYLKAASAVSAIGSQTLVLEDSEFGVKAGLAANFQVIQIPDLLEPSPELLSLGHRVCTDLHEVLELLKSSRQ